jgi:hypothetical protein
VPCTSEGLSLPFKKFLTPSAPANQAPATKAESVYPNCRAFLLSDSVNESKNLFANLSADCICNIGLFKKVFTSTPAISSMLFHSLLPYFPCIN